jgi:hypothetical protein
MEIQSGSAVNPVNPAALMDREELNSMLKNLDNFYWATVQAGFYLP